MEEQGIIYSPSEIKYLINSVEKMKILTKIFYL